MCWPSPRCACCALCHQNPTCASLSFSPATGECRLHSTVAGYDTLTPDNSWKYFVMPGRSQHHQFCRQDSDCLVKGDFCRGRVCTNQTAVTCRVIYQTFGAADRFGNYISPMFGWLNNTGVLLACRMGSKDEGYTRIFRSYGGKAFDRETMFQYNSELTEDVQHSMLYLADHLRHAGTEDTYQLKVHPELYSGYFYAVIDFQVPRAEPVLSDVPRPGVGSLQTSSNFLRFRWTMTMPYVPAASYLSVELYVDVPAR
ncbi:hypothetical protein FJT64_015768 [Amphibalanus amphitrite]|uniref:Apple domain-containing protein n=1 Tax=Amphibalanus amphitrite TaxID=1232801 RepID=A0A6A4XCA8_AMPAM|nr:hypothetical protein FJT64_015768 [Amphibalanus amphitrite]